MGITRRHFLAQIAATTALSGNLGRSWADTIPSDIHITRIIGFDLPCSRRKSIGKDARHEPHGDTVREPMVRIYTDAGIEGIGRCEASKEQLRPLIGESLSRLYSPQARRLKGVAEAAMPVWDLIGKAVDQPVYQLLGGEGPERVPVCDSSLYFSDLQPEHALEAMDRFRREVDQGLERGHRAFKVKIGRGHRWMPRREGRQQDSIVLNTILDHVDRDITVGAEADQVYDLEDVKELVDRLGDVQPDFLSEMLIPVVSRYRDLQSHLADQDRPVDLLVSPGHDRKTLSAFMESGVVDAIRRTTPESGLDELLSIGADARASGLKLAFHHWGSLCGFYLQLHAARAIPNLYLAEVDPLQSDLLIDDGYQIHNGYASVPDEPGFGIGIDGIAFVSDADIRFDLD